MDIAVYYTLYFQALNQAVLAYAASDVFVQVDTDQMKALNH